MTRQEFIEKIAEIDEGKAALADRMIHDEQYRMIETVYTFHPVIDEVEGKKQIAMIYAAGGMAVIRDMVPTAIRGRQIEAELRELQAKEHNLKGELERLRTGKEEEIG